MIARYEGSLSIDVLCETLDVSRSGYYAWRKREPSQRQQADNHLGDQVEKAFNDSRRTYGSYKIFKKLRADGVYTSHKRVARLMRERGLRSIRDKRRRWGITKAAQNRYVMPNLLQQDFEATRVHEKWVTDTTYIPTHQGWLYLVIVLD